MGTLTLSLVSHTNAGKTTLTRTLLGRDVGEVRDAPHVTEFADAYVLIETPAGDSLRLYDTPGFGDSVRLVKRLRIAHTPLGWFLSQVWDRWRDRPYWSTQQALLNVRDEADVVLYLVNAAEEPAAAGYVAPEMELLAWLGKPVIALLNQLGAPRAAADEEAEVQRWRAHLAPHALVVEVLPLDAFARCWVQEVTLLHAIERALDGERRALMQRLRTAWQDKREQTFHASMRSLAQGLARIAMARHEVAETAGLGERLRQFGSALGIVKAEDGPLAAAQRALAAELDAEVRASTTALISLHGLAGEASSEILSLLAEHYEVVLRVDEGRAALMGGMLTGALAGLKADVASGGMTLGGGMLAGGLLGALGAAGLARCYNIVRGAERSWLAWSAPALDQAIHAALLRYLAVAHFGRGRGEWRLSEVPPFWSDAVAAALDAHREKLKELWRYQAERAHDAGDAEQLAAALQPLLAQAASAVLARLYPGGAAPGHRID